MNLRDRAEKIANHAITRRCTGEGEFFGFVAEIESALREAVLEESRQGIRLAAESYRNGWNQAIEEAAKVIDDKRNDPWCGDECLLKAVDTVLSLKRKEGERK